MKQVRKSTSLRRKKVQTHGFGQILRESETKLKNRLEHPRLLEESEGAHRRTLEEVERDER